MFLSFYKLNEKPFQITSDSKFLWLGEKHQEAFATLKYGVLDNKGFLLLTGEVGTGKTTLINALVNSLGSDVVFAKIPDPRLDELDFYRYISKAFQLPKMPETKVEFLFELTRFLEKAYTDRKQVLLIVDEAQRLRSEILEEIRLLSNIEREHVKLLNIFFVGQVEFNDILLKPENKAIRQRITVNYSLDRLTEDEVKKYIAHRLKIAGSEQQIFTDKAIYEIYLFSTGTPRLINIICDRALLTGFVEEKAVIDEDIIQECADELQITPNLAGAAGHLPRGIHQEVKESPVASTIQDAPAPEISIRLPRVRKKRASMLGIYLVYFLLLFIIFGIVMFFFVSPEDFPILDLGKVIGVDAVTGEN
ncbi:MAG: AAA family ATPase [Desulfobulbaceae bacterium]|uniref:AAA family ATPase n=1 Tax=Candidatus Desulfobia pelagia TaxID=2841692 RepID=A0A8J6NEG9_9BACT|nr:AAA family ATPase [Candidatus Desulfobia pelagia]